MNREEAIRAMLDGKKVRATTFAVGCYCYYNKSNKSPFRFKRTCADEAMSGAFDNKCWELYEEPKPKKRYMTREEVLGFVCNTPGIVVRFDRDIWRVSSAWSYESRIDRYEYAYIDKKGNIGEPHKFMVDVD